MADLNPREKIGGNNPPDPIDTLTAPFDGDRSEAENWLDGTPVETEAQMKAVDALRASMRQWRLGLERGQKDATAPLHEIYKAELERWKPIIADAKRIEDGLVACGDTFKRKLAAEKEAARKEAERVAWEATRAAAKAMEDAEAAQQAAMAEKKDTVKGLRSVTHYEVTDHRALLHYIAKEAREDVTAFIDEWARKNHKEFPNADGLRVWIAKESF
jgi:hypothetical protein